MTNRAVFLDRDGVLNKDEGYVGCVDDFHFIEGTIEALQSLKQAGFLLVLVTNQSGIARGRYSEDDFINLTEWMDWSLADKGVDLDGIYYCPHHPEHGLGEYKIDCDCRKPKPGMLLTAASELDINMAKSFMVGDKASDLQAAINAGVAHPILVKTGKVLSSEATALAELVTDNLASAAAYIIKSEQG